MVGQECQFEVSGEVVVVGPIHPPPNADDIVFLFKVFNNAAHGAL